MIADDVPVYDAAIGSTGHPEIDAALSRLDGLDGLPVDRHGEILDDVHAQLRDALAAAAAPASEHAGD